MDCPTEPSMPIGERGATRLLALSACLNVLLGWLLLADVRDGRRLGEHPASDEAERDCASVACPRLFTEATPVETGLSKLTPMIVDTRYRLHGPRNMLDLTRLLCGDNARLGEPYRNFTNPFGRSPSLRYDWTQINERQLEQTFAMLPNGGRNARLVVEVGSFIGRSSVLIGRWLRRRELLQQHENKHLAAGRGHGRGDGGTASSSTWASVSLLCIDTWSGDVAMTLGQIYPVEMGKRNGMPTLYHQWLLNVIQSNLTGQVLPLMAPSLMGARVLDYLRISIDVLYLDSAHEQRETFMELTAYWPLIKPGGVLLGDDFNWRAVSHDVQLFVRTHKLQLRSFSDCHEHLRSGTKAGLCVWYIQKPTTDSGGPGTVDRRPTMRTWLGNKWSNDP